MFNPADILTGILTKFGLTPEHAQGAYNAVIGEVAANRTHRARIEAEAAAFKAASGPLMARVFAQLDALQGEVAALRRDVAELRADVARDPIPTVEEAPRAVRLIASSGD